MPILLSHILQCSSEFIIPCQEQHVIIQLKCIEYTQVNADENRRLCPYFGRYWWAAPVINLDQGESSFMAVFSTRGAFFRNAGAKVQFFWAENKNMAKKGRKKSVSIWFIAIYIKLNFAFNIFGKTKVGTILQNDTALERTFSTRYLFDFQIVITLKSLKQTQLFNIKIGKACILEK